MDEVKEFYLQVVRRTLIDDAREWMGRAMVSTPLLGGDNVAMAYTACAESIEATVALWDKYYLANGN